MMLSSRRKWILALCLFLILCAVLLYRAGFGPKPQSNSTWMATVVTSGTEPRAILIEGRNTGDTIMDNAAQFVLDRHNVKLSAIERIPTEEGRLLYRIRLTQAGEYELEADDRTRSVGAGKVLSFVVIYKRTNQRLGYIHAEMKKVRIGSDTNGA